MKITTYNNKNQPVNKRLRLCSINYGRVELYITTDTNKTYVTIHHGMQGEGVLEIGYSSVNGSLSAEFDKYLIELCSEALMASISQFAKDTPIPTTEYEWLQYMHLMTICIDRAYNKWLGANQKLFIDNQETNCVHTVKTRYTEL